MEDKITFQHDFCDFFFYFYFVAYIVSDFLIYEYLLFNYDLNDNQSNKYIYININQIILIFLE